MKVSSSEEGTNYYICDKCGKPCDWIKESSAQRLRKNKEYRLKELRDNAKRSKKKGYDLGRTNEIAMTHRKRREIVGKYVTDRRKNWTNSELDFLKEHRGCDYSNIAIFLGRSLSSIEHKMVRMRLQKYNNWTKKLK